MKKLLLLLGLAVFVGFIFSGCIGTGNQPGISGSGSLVLNVSESGVNKTIEPGIDMTIAAYDIIGSGPNGANFRRENVTPGRAVTINTLAVGNWTIEVNAKNADGIFIAYGVTTVTVTSGVTVNASVTVRPINGNGILNITVSWPAGIISNPSVTGTLIPVGGTAQSISYTLASDHLSATYQNNTIPTGYYTLITQLKDGPTLKWSAVDAVRIINGQTSIGTYELIAVQGQFGEIELIIKPDLQNPIGITFTGQQSILPVGTDMTITATTSEPVDTYQWYLNGTPLPGVTNATLTIGRTLGVGSYLLAIVVTKENIVSSNSFGFSVGTPTPTPTPTPTLTPTPIPSHTPTPSPTPGPAIYAATYGGGLSISTNGGQTFTTYTTTNGLGANYFRGIYVSGSTIYAATWGGLSISTNGGQSFTNYTTNNGLGDNDVWGTYVSGTTIYVATWGGLSKSTNDGLSFTNYTTASGLGSNSLHGVYVSGSTIYVATYGGGLSISTNGGVSFTNYTNAANGLGYDYVYKVYVSGSTIYAATAGGGLSISTNGGTSFTTYTSVNGLGSGTVCDVTVSEGTIYAATTGGLSISTNGGKSFTNYTTVNGLGSNTVWGVYVFGDAIYAATTGGLSISTNGGSSFTNYTTINGLGSNDVRGIWVQ